MTEQEQKTQIKNIEMMKMVRQCGTSAHILLPRSLLNKRVLITIKVLEESSS